mgnify:CR=1 FL=1|jgi:UDP-N-acetylglucosamine 2-epimerase
MVAPVVRAMARRGCDTRMLALTTAQSYLSNRGIPHFGYQDFPEAADPRAVAYGEALSGPDVPGRQQVPRRESVAYLGVNFLDMVEEVGESEARARYAARQRQAFLPIATMRRLLERERPDLVVVTSSPRTEKALAVAAREKGIPVACIVDLLDVHGMPAEAYPGYADRFLVLSEAVRQTFLDYGCRPEQVVVTGNPAFDRLSTPQAIAAGAELRRVRGWGTKRVILWASQIEPSVHPFTGEPADPTLPGRIEQALRGFVREREGVRLVVRHHPSDPADFVPGPQVEFSPQEEDLGALLHAVDAVVVMTSTVGLEAAIVGRPVLSVECSVFSKGMPYSAMGIAEGVAKPEELASSLDRVFSGSGKSRQTINAPAVGAATGKVCEELLSILSERCSERKTEISK